MSGCQRGAPVIIFSTARRTYPQERGARRQNDFKNDLTGGYLGGASSLMFSRANGPEWFLAPTMNAYSGAGGVHRNGKDLAITDPLVQAKNPAVDRGARLPGFNDGHTGEAPDIGAFETGLCAVALWTGDGAGVLAWPWEQH